MQDQKSERIYNIGTWVGRKQAFASLAGRCSAADAECLRQIRDRKEYRALGLSWREFCKQRAGVALVTANRLIGLLEEFGPQYFILTQATGISENEYRRLSSAVQGQKLLHAGEEIPIHSDNTPRLVAAVEALKKETAPARVAGSADDAEKARAEVAREMKRAGRDLRSGLERYSRLAARRLERHMRLALIDDLGIFAGSIKDLYDDTRLR